MWNWTVFFKCLLQDKIKKNQIKQFIQVAIYFGDWWASWCCRLAELLYLKNMQSVWINRQLAETLPAFSICPPWRLCDGVAVGTLYPVSTDMTWLPVLTSVGRLIPWRVLCRSRITRKQMGCVPSLLPYSES